MKPDQARLLRMAAVLLPVAFSSIALSLADDVPSTSKFNEAAVLPDKDAAASARKQVIGAPRGLRLGLFSRNLSV